PLGETVRREPSRHTDLRSRPVDRGDLAGGRRTGGLRRARATRSAIASARLAFSGMVFTNRRSRRRDPVLSRPPAPSAVGAQADARGRGGPSQGVSADPAPGVRPRAPARLSPPASPPLARALRKRHQEIPRILPAEPRQPTLRPTPAPLLRAEPSRG